jgi:hypothetical protein
MEFIFRLIFSLTEALRLLCTQDDSLDEVSERWGVW